MNRREFFLGGASAFALVKSSPALAGFRKHGSAAVSTGFNGGKSQGQSISNFGTTLDFPFINMLKSGSTWFGTDTSNSGTAIDPSWLSSDGYPNQVGTFGVFQNVNLPVKSTWTANSLGNLVLMWDVTGAGAADTWRVTIGNFATTIVGTDTRSGTGNGTNFTCTFDPTNGYNNILPGGSASFQMVIQTLNGTAHVTNMRLAFASLIPAGDPHLATTVFNPQFEAKIKAFGTGVWRFLDWLATSTSNVTTWATRKSLGYPTYSDDEYRASLYPGDVMTNTSGNNLDYQISTSSTPYTWPGYTRAALVDKMTMHVHFSSNAALVQNGESGSGDPTGTLVLSGLGAGNTILFTWTAHPLSNGDPVSLNQDLHGGSPLQGTWSTQILYVVNKATNTFQLATSPGGSAIVTTDTSTHGNMIVTRLQTQNLDGLGAIPILSAAAQPFVRSFLLPQSKNGNAKLYGTMVYDVTFNAWLLTGASNNSSNGIQSCVPIEACLQLCKETGMHPHISVPFMALDTFTDYVPSLDAYIQANMPSWMIPRYEPANEIWNNGTNATQFAYGKSFAYFGTQFDPDRWYGMALSIFGQALKTSRGGTGLGTTYEVLCGMQTDGGGTPIASGNERTDATSWIASGPSRPPYVKQAGSLTASAGLIATYVNPSYQGTLQELELAWQYFNGASPGQLATLNSYADSLGFAVIGTGVLTIASPGVVNWPSHGRSVGDLIRLSTTGALPSGTQQYPNFVKTVIDADHFTLSSTMTNGVVGSAQNWSGTQSGTQYVTYSNGNAYETIRYINWKTFFTSKSLSKMFAYEGGYSPDLFVALVDYNSPVSGTIANANPTVVTLPYTNTNDGWGQYPGNPAQVGMPIALTGVGGMTQLNCLASGVTLTDASASIAWSGNILIAGQVVMFRSNVNLLLTTSILPLTPYYVIATGLSSSAFQISTTKGGSPITISITGGGTIAATADSGWAVNVVSGNNISLDVDSSAFGTHTANTGFASYVDSANLVNNFRVAVLQLSPDLQTQLLANYNNYTTAGGLFPSQYGFGEQGPGAADQSVWQSLDTDVWGSFNQQGLMIQAYN